LEIELDDEGRESYERVNIGDIPIMVKSTLCLLSRHTEDELIKIGEDPKEVGGYFIVNGSERVIVSLEDLAPNRVLVETDNRGSKPVYKGKVFSTTVGFRARIEMARKAKGEMGVTIPGVPVPVPLVVLMRALGVETDREVATMVSLDPEILNNLEASFKEAGNIPSIEDAILFIGNRVAFGQVKEFRIKRAQTILDRNLLPHLGREPEHRFDKAVFLGEMASRIIELKLGQRSEDDKDQPVPQDEHQTQGRTYQRGHQARYHHQQDPARTCDWKLEEGQGRNDTAPRQDQHTFNTFTPQEATEPTEQVTAELPGQGPTQHPLGQALSQRDP
jgi:DNA-directed RNA polymerase subunit B